MAKYNIKYRLYKRNVKLYKMNNTTKCQVSEICRICQHDPIGFTRRLRYDCVKSYYVTMLNYYYYYSTHGQYGRGTISANSLPSFRRHKPQRSK